MVSAIQVIRLDFFRHRAPHHPLAILLRHTGTALLRSLATPCCASAPSIRSCPVSEPKAKSPDSCGGTLGAIFSIFLAGLTTSLLSSASSGSEVQVDASFWGKSALVAVETLKQRTAARKGHRTVMDAMIPFAETLAETGDFEKAVKACKNGGEATATMIAKLGRATYVGERSDRAMPPDPGAMAFVAVIEGIAKALK